MKNPQTHRDTFLSISARLTGFDAVELQGTGMVETYYDTVIAKSDATTLDLFFAEVAAILHEAGGDGDRLDALIGSRLMPLSSYDGLARNIIVMWYNSQWYPDTINSTVPIAAQTMISGEAYVQGLVWTAAETHPPGAKQPGYGSWAAKPIRIPS